MDGSKTATVSSSTLRDAHAAVWNGLKVGASLILTWGIAVAVRFVLPRYLGPEVYGSYTFAEAMALTFFVFATLGVDTYVQKEIPLRPAHASEFFGAITVARVALSAALLLSLGAFLVLTDRSTGVLLAALAFGVGQLFFVHNATFVAMLNARGRVDGMSVANVATKVSWALCVLAAVSFRLSLWALASAFVVSEALRAVILYRLCRRHLELRFEWRPALLWPTLRRCAPFFVTMLAVTLYARLDIALMGYLANEREVGFYSAAAMVSNLGLLLIPLISSVLLPLFARAQARSNDELRAVLHRSLTAVITLSMPVSVALYVGAEVWIHLIGGAQYAPAAAALKAIAPMFVLNYLAMLCASCLNLLNRAWAVTWISLGALVVNALLNALLIPAFHLRLGDGGGGVGAAFAGVSTEVFACGAMLVLLRGWAFSASVIRTLLMLTFSALVVVLIDGLWRDLGGTRLLLDAAILVALLFATGTVRPVELRTLALQFRRGSGGFGS